MAGSLLFFAAGGALGAGDPLAIPGVDPWAALNDRWGLDMRDSSNRPISRGGLERGLKKALSAWVADAAYSSRLPQARAVTLARELLEPAGASLVASFQALLPRGVWALAPGSRSTARLLLVLIFALAALGRAGAPCRPRQGACGPASARALVLRC